MKKSLICLMLIFFCGISVNAKTYTYNKNTMQVEIVEENSQDKIKKLTELIEYNEVKKANPSEISMLYWARGGFYSMEKQYSEALKDFNASLKYNSKNIETLKSLVLLQMDIKDYDGALMTVNKIIQLKPNDSKNYMTRAQIYFELVQYQNAINDYTKAIILKPKNPDAFYFRGMIEILAKQKDKGLKDLQFAKQQFYELEMYDQYQEVSKFITNLNQIQNKPISKTTYSNNYYTPSVQYSGYNNDGLEKINKSIESLERTMLLLH